VRVLVAEDDKVVSLQICGLLKQRGYVPTPVFDSLQAIMTAMRSPHPDGIILDIGMPGGTGIETLKRLKASSRTNNIPVVVVSGTIDPAQSDQVIALGAEAFLPKPVDPETLGATVERVFGTPVSR
jgi:chemotaxis family two-component system response regulator PixH